MKLKNKVSFEVRRMVIGAKDAFKLAIMILGTVIRNMIFTALIKHLKHY